MLNTMDNDRYGRFTVDNSRLLLWCMEWFHLELARIRENNEKPVIREETLGVFYRPLRFFWDPIIKFLTIPHKYDPDEVDELFAQGVQALKNGDQTTALSDTLPPVTMLIKRTSVKPINMAPLAVYGLAISRKTPTNHSWLTVTGTRFGTTKSPAGIRTLTQL